MPTPHPADRYQTARERVLELLTDQRWHGYRQLVRVGGVRATGRVSELRRIGYPIRSRPDPSGHGKQYQLTSLHPVGKRPKRVRVYLAECDAALMEHDENVPVGARRAIRKALASFRRNRGKP